MPGEAAAPVQDKQKEAAGPEVAAPGFAVPSFGSTGTRSHEQAILNLQQTAGNRAVTNLLSGIQRAPRTAADVWGAPQREDEDRTTAGSVALLGSSAKLPQSGSSTSAPAQPVSAKEAPPRPAKQAPAGVGGGAGTAAPASVSLTEMVLSKREAETTALFGESDLAIDRTSTKPVSLLSLQEVDEEIHRLERISAKRERTGPDDVAREERLQQLRARRGDGAKGSRQGVPDAAKRDEKVRQNDVLRALTPLTDDPMEGLKYLVALVQKIDPDPQNAGWALLHARGMVIPIREDELDTFRAAMTWAFPQFASRIFSVAIEVLEDYRARLETNRKHPAVHKTVKTLGRVEDLDPKHIQHDYEMLGLMRDTVGAVAGMGMFPEALDHMLELTAAVERFGDRVAKWEQRLLSVASVCAIVMTIVKELLVLLATGMASSITTARIAAGASKIAAGLKVTSASMAAGGGGALTASLVGQGISGDFSARESAGSTMKGMAEGWSIGAAPTIGKYKKASMLGKEASVARVGVSEALSSTAVNLPASLMRGDGARDTGATIAGGTISGVGGEMVKHGMAPGTYWATAASGLVGGTSGYAQSVMAGKNDTDTGIAVGMGILGATVGPKIEQAGNRRAGVLSLQEAEGQLSNAKAAREAAEAHLATADRAITKDAKSAEAMKLWAEREMGPALEVARSRVAEASATVDVARARLELAKRTNLGVDERTREVDQAQGKLRDAQVKLGAAQTQAVRGQRVAEGTAESRKGAASYQQQSKVEAIHDPVEAARLYLDGKAGAGGNVRIGNPKVYMARWKLTHNQATSAPKGGWRQADGTIVLNLSNPEVKAAIARLSQERAGAGQP